MRQKERETLLSAIDDLEQEYCEWEDAMEKLYALAGLEYKDHRKQIGKSISILELLNDRRA